MGKENRLESYPWYPSDWRGDPDVIRLNSAARGLYREILDYVWERGYVEADQKLLRKLIGIEYEEFRRLWPKVQPFFVEKDGRLYHTKVDERRPKCIEMREKRLAASSAGGRAKALLAAQSSQKRTKTDTPPESGRSVTGEKPDKNREFDAKPLKDNETDCAPGVPQVCPAPTLTLTTRSVAAFASDVDRFEREFPQTVSDLDVQNFISQIGSEADQKLFFEVLAANNSTRKWRGGYSTSAKTYLTTGLWRKMPKPEGTQDAPTMYLPLERE